MGKNIVRLQLSKRKREDLEEVTPIVRLKVKKPKISSVVQSSTLFKIIQQLFQSDVQQIFWYEVDEALVPGYHTVIKQPMFLQRIQQKLEKNVYHVAREIFDDFNLMFNNAKTFNMEGSIFYLEAERLQKEAKSLRKGIKKNSEIHYDQTKGFPLPAPQNLSNYDEGFEDEDEFENSEEFEDEPVMEDDIEDDAIEKIVDTPPPEVKKGKRGRKGRKDTQRSEIQSTEYEYSGEFLEGQEELNEVIKNYPAMTSKQLKIFKNQCRYIISQLRSLDANNKFFSGTVTKGRPKLTKPLDYLTIDSRIENGYYRKPTKFRDELYGLFEKAISTNPNPNVVKAAKDTLAKLPSIIKEAFTSSTENELVDSTKLTLKPLINLSSETTEKFVPRVSNFDSFPRLSLDHLKAIMRQMLDRLHLEDSFGVFSKYPDPKFHPDFEEMIAYPVDLTMIEEKLKNEELKSWADFDYLLELLFGNYRHYYSKDTVFYDEAVRVQNFVRTTRNRMIEKLRRNPSYPLDQLVPSFTSKQSKQLEKFKSRLSSMKHQDPDLFQRMAQNAVTYASRLDNKKFFVTPMSREQYPGFYTLVENPICVERMQYNLDEGRYTDFREFRRDLEQVYKNALSFFSEDNVHYQEAKFILKFVSEKNDDYEEIITLNNTLPPAPATSLRALSRKPFHRNDDAGRRSQRDSPVLVTKRSTRNSRAIEEYEQEQITPDIPFTSTVMKAHHSTPAISSERKLPNITKPVFNVLMPRIKHVTKSYVVPLEPTMKDNEFEFIANMPLSKMFMRAKSSNNEETLTDYIARIQRSTRDLLGDGALQNQSNSSSQIVTQGTRSIPSANGINDNVSNKEENSGIQNIVHRLQDTALVPEYTDILSDLKQIECDDYIKKEFSEGNQSKLWKKISNILEENKVMV